jgi:hypothetical protein
MVLGSSLYFLVPPTSGRLNHPTSDTRKFVFFSQLGSGSASLFADVDLLGPWDYPVVKVRTEDYRDSHLNKIV